MQEAPVRFGEFLLSVRSTRRFQNGTDGAVTMPDTFSMRSIVDAGRQSACAGNLQRLSYSTVVGLEACAKVFPHLRWAGYMKEWDGPEEGERPTAYVIIWHRPEDAASDGIDIGIAAQNMVLTAWADYSLASCMIAAFDKEGLKQTCGVADLSPALVIAFGPRGENIVLEEIDKTKEPKESVKYWRDAEGIHHVPKRTLADVLVKTPNL